MIMWFPLFGIIMRMFCNISTNIYTYTIFIFINPISYRHRINQTQPTLPQFTTECLNASWCRIWIWYNDALMMQLNKIQIQDTKLFTPIKNIKDINVQSFLNAEITYIVQQYICSDNRCTNFQMCLYHRAIITTIRGRVVYGNRSNHMSS